MLGFGWSQWALALSAFLYLAYKWSTATYGFFKAKNVVFMKPVPFFGNFGATLTKTKTFHEVVLDSYNAFKTEKYFGMFLFREPLLVIRDPDAIRQLVVKNFEHFANHRDALFKEEVEPLMGKSLFMMKDQKWRDMRATLSPAFTGSKMRLMFQLIVNSADDAMQVLLIEALAKQVKGEGNFEIELKDVFTRCMTDVIATTAFGLEVNSLRDRDNQFYNMGAKSVQLQTIDFFRAMFIEKFPRFCKLLNIKLFSDDHVEFYRSLVLDTMRHRNVHGIVRPDMIQLLMESKKGSLKMEESPPNGADDGFATVAESNENRNLGNAKRVWSDADYTSQCFLFFLAGFETSSTLMCVAVHELAENRDVQTRLMAEIDEVRGKLDGKPLSYELLQTMHYLDMVVSETLRKWPPAIATDRSCTVPYKFVDETNGQELHFARGDSIWVPILGLHRDPKYFPQPDVFDPERFSVENRDNIQPFTYMPFGVGPRNCIASRFALMEAKAFLFTLLSNFTVHTTEKTQIPLKLVQTGFGINAEKGFHVHLQPRERNE